MSEITNRKVKRGDIYWIQKNPYRNEVGSVQKPGRPAIIVGAVTGYDLTYEIVYLTTQPKRDLPTHCTIRSAKQVSTALCEQITTVSNEQLAEYIGTCTTEEMHTIERCMMTSLEIWPGRPDPAQEAQPGKVIDLKKEAMKEQLKAGLINAKMDAERLLNLYKQLYA